MPFMGRDWRSPGEAWVKTESLGWQRMKIIESQLHLTACHQSHPACSWPPRSQFGQHMAQNCNKAQNNECDKELGGGVCDSRSARSLSSCGSSSDSSSGQSSASTSPTGTPEKNNSSRHLHPIAISSPYGRYSTSPCCSHHSYSANQNNNNDAKSSPCGCVNPRYSTGSPLQMSKSLSRETLVEPHCTSPVGGPKATLSYNKSVSDFRNTSSYIDEHAPERAEENNSGQREANTTGHFENNLRHSAPILMQNGVRIDNKDPQMELKAETSDLSPPSPEVGQVAGDRSTSPSPAQEADPSCSCCCCCSSHYHHILKEPQPRTAPHCRISVRTREVAMHNTISEAFYRLDFYNAIHDIRRFNYICKLLHLLITQNLTSLSGCATRVLFTMLEQVAREVSSNKTNIHVIRNLLEELRLTIQKYYCWGRPIGSSLLWQQHFETIERISRLVNGIELSPPKDGSYRVTFNHLPVEMVREILLRLNDYRDLVSSAQASPLMRTMIDDQNIWRKLCRYHFTEQQLKLALENNDLVGVKRRTLRGIKYARTASADGRTSYRKPVTHKQPPSPLSSSSSSSSTTAMTTRQQLKETADRRNPARTQPKHTSQVTNAVKIFDRPGQSAGSDRDQLARSQPAAQEKENRPSSSSHTGSGRTWSSSRRSQSDIDWEHVFHQLRKRFDLKEEYADCLLLCRHCRCLFWKSFGHPCIRGHEIDQENSSQPLDGAQSTRGLDHAPDSRPSVASLSRNFDRQVPQGGANGENVDARNLNHQRAALNANQDGHDNGLRADWQRRPLNDLNAQLREQNANRLQRQRARQPEGQVDDEAHLGGSPARGGEELVPKHVTITPQAFLKFFSL